MDIRQLNYFVQVADCGSYSKAAQKLFISQAALSKTIKNMEEEMGFAFFYTHQRKQLLTEAGQAFYDKTVHFLGENRSEALNAFIDFTSDKKVYYDLSSKLTPEESM